MSAVCGPAAPAGFQNKIPILSFVILLTGFQNKSPFSFQTLCELNRGGGMFRDTFCGISVVIGAIEYLKHVLLKLEFYSLSRSLG